MHAERVRNVAELAPNGRYPRVNFDNRLVAASPRRPSETMGSGPSPPLGETTTASETPARPVCDNNRIRRRRAVIA